MILEAGAQSLPAVAYDVGGVAEAVQEKTAGRVIEPGDEESFAQAVADVLDAPRLRQRFGCSARVLTESECSLDDSVRKFEGLCEQAIANAKNASDRRSTGGFGNISNA